MRESSIVLPATTRAAVDALGGSAARAVLQSLPHAVLLLDSQLLVVLANRGASQLFRATPEQLRGTPITSIVPQKHLPAMLRDFGGRSTKVIETSLPARGRSGTAATVKITAVRVLADATRSGQVLPNTAAAGSREFRLLVLEDITEKALLEQQLVESEKQAAIGQLAAGILHEVANPLASLASNLLFVRGALAAAPAEVTQAVDVSLDQLNHMRQLLGTLSGFPSRVAPKYEVADLHETVRTCVTFIAKDAERRHIHLSVRFAPEAATCEMDVRLIRQVLLNLLKNAMEAMPHGGRLDVTTSARPAKDSGPAVVVIQIADSGAGIAESDLRKVFRPLFSTKPRGAGLGLSFCRQTVEEHGGDIRLTSAGPDRGTVATVSLPVRQSDAPDVAL